ncbi:TetR/AcrR family transcriptional regulator [Streptomyces chartreusis]|uniref:TetR/AcrR family transcriptional regulator n=1 Tax=Streptomyces chartreusis TaxID=1969 RepID=A0A7H8T2B1_STRCX|nr:TetR/AcrR family transcriptional regulator [Streptomyces chartreusis]QKZ17158.1 TetR/AcrR family transcriptional regulator [Streptomyces chartreusis]
MFDQDEGAASLTLRERNKARLRQAMLLAALEVFAQSGYGSATVEAIATRAGVAKVTLYTYFPRGREELFRELYENINGELIENASQIYASEGRFADRVIALTQVLVKVAQRPLIGRFYSIDDPALDVALDDVRGRASRVWADLIAEDLAAEQQTGTVKTQVSPQAFAELLLGAMRSALSKAAREQEAAGDIVQAMTALLSGL